MDFLPSLLLLCILSTAAGANAAATAAVGTIERTTKQQILAAIPPNAVESSVPFLTSPSGKYTASLLRRETAPGAGGLGNDFCYIQVRETSTGRSMWESECGPVSSANACAAAFTVYGLQVFDGATPVWDTGAESADANYLQSLELVDQGDMRIRDKGGELAWKASDDPRAGQDCGMPGSPGLSPALPPFSTPIGGNGGSLPFGRPAAGGVQQQLSQSNMEYVQQQQQQQLPPEQSAVFGGAKQNAFGFDGNRPLVDNSPYDSGCSGGASRRWVGVGVALLLLVLV